MSNNLDDAGLWFESRHAEIQEYNEPEPVNTFVNLDDDEADKAGEQSEVTNKQVRTELNMIKLNEPTAQIVVTLMDTLVPVLLLLIIKGANEDKLKLTGEEKETLTQAWAQYLKDSNVQMSPGAVLIGTVAVIYGAKITLALTEMKRNQKENEELKQLRAELDLLKKSMKDAA